MSERKDEKWLDNQLQRAVNGSTPVFDAEAWKHRYAGEFETLLRRSGQPSRSGIGDMVRRVLKGYVRGSHRQGGSLKAEGLGDGWAPVPDQSPLTGQAIPKLRLRLPPVLTHPLRSSIGKIAIAATIIIAAGVLLVGRLGFTPDRPTPAPRPIAQDSPAQMVSMISLSAAFRTGGMEGLDKQCDRALERLGPRPTNVSVQDLLKDINGKG